MKPLHGILALVLLVVAVLFVIDSTSEDDARAGLSVESTEQDKSDGAQSLPDMPAAPEHPQRSSAAPEDPPLVEEPAEALPIIETPAYFDWVLWLDLQGPVVDGPVLVKIRARPDGSPFAGSEAVVAECEVNQRTRLSLDELLAPGHVLSALVIETEHASLLSKQHNVTLMASVSSETSPLPVVETTLVLDSSARVIGHTVERAGHALKTRIGIWRFQGERLDEAILRDESTDGEGRFNLELPGFGEYLIVVAHRDQQPAWQRFSVHAANAVHDTGALTLEAGVAIAGSFTVGGHPPPYPVSFTLRREVDGQDLHWDWWRMQSSPGTTTWTGTGIERSSADQVAYAKGSFRVAGLSPGSYKMHLHGYDEGHARMVRKPIEMSAPASGVAIELDWSRVAIRLDLEDPSSPPLAAKLILERPGHVVESADCYGGELAGEAGREFVFEAGEPLTFQLEIEGIEPLRHELVAPPAGERSEVRFQVPAIDRSAKLRLVLSGEVPADGTSFVVHVASLDRGPADAALGLVGDNSARTLELKKGALLVEGLSPGRVYVLAYPGKWSGQRASHLLDATTEIELQSNREALAYLRFERAGRLRVGKRDGQGGWARASCHILNGEGAKIETTFVSYAPDGGGGASARETLPDFAPSEVVPNLAPGQYTVHVGSEQRTVSVRAGETTEVIFD